jgi:hypothetical protein
MAEEERAQMLISEILQEFSIVSTLTKISRMRTLQKSERSQQVKSTNHRENKTKN